MKSPNSTGRTLALLMVAGILLGGVEVVAAPRLHFVKSIGNAWREGEWSWMGFVTFSGDGKVVASDGLGANDSEGALWSFPERAQLRRLPFNPWAISRDFKYYAWAHGYGEVQSGKTLFALPADEWGHFTFSPDGSLLAVGVYGTGTVWLIDVGSGAILDRAKVSDIGCGSVAFSPDGRFLIAPSTGGLIKWPLDYGGTIRVFEVRPR